VQKPRYLISKASRHRSKIIPSYADEMPLYMSITAGFGNLEVVFLMNLGLCGRPPDANVHISTYLVTRHPLKSRLFYITFHLRATS
jgi:hypothetical protein